MGQSRFCFRSTHTEFRRDIAKPVAALTVSKADEVKLVSCAQYEALRTPVTPVSGAALTSLLKMIKQIPNDETNKPHKEWFQLKVNNAAQTAFAKDSLHIRFLTKMNDKSKPRRSTKSVILGKAKAMSYEDFKEAREKRAARDAAATAKPNEVGSARVLLSQMKMNQRQSQGRK
jgi:hypothetical protein